MEQINERKRKQLIPDFFEGRTIFLTGASGFVGMVILETLLRCCPGIASVYILLRSKGSLLPEQRKELIFQKKVFKVLKEKNPKMLEKVHTVAGDISKPEFGMNAEDLKCIKEQVSIVFHCAANINLNKPLRYTVEQNGNSTKTIIELCRMMKHFTVLVYTSTSYCNCNHVGVPIKEKVYRLPFHANKFLDALEKNNDDELLELVSLCKPDWPSWYLFSKCLSENILQDMASDLAVAIIRPSVVGCTWKSPMPGYADENSGFALLLSSVGDSLVSVMFGDPEIKINIIPADILANTHIIAAWSVGSKKVSSPLVVNCTSVGYMHIKWMECFKIIKKIRQESLQKCSRINRNLIMIKRRFLYRIANIYRHYIPAIVTDIILKIKGRKSRMFATYYILHRFLFSMGVIELNSSDYETNNMDYLNGILHNDDKKNFDIDSQSIKPEEYFKSPIEVLPSPSWRKDLEIMNQYGSLISFIQYLVLIFCGCLIYWITITVFHLFQLI